MKKRFIKVVLTAVLVLCITGVYSHAEEEHVCFRAVDADENGEVTYPEFEKVYENGREKFDRIDTDQNGIIAHDEYHKSLGHGSDKNVSDDEMAQ